MTSDIPDTVPADWTAPVTEDEQDTATAPRHRAATVPELVGMPAAEAHDRALDAGVLAVAENAWHTGAGRARIGHQDPEPGRELASGGIVRIWIDTGSGTPPA
jgi:hypothetical protein